MRGPFLPSWLPSTARASRSAPPPDEPSFAELAEAVPNIPRSPPPPAIPYAPDGWLPPDAAEALEQRMRELEAELGWVATELARVRTEVLLESEPELVRLALAVAEKVVGHAVEVSPGLVAEWASEGIAALASKDGVVVAIGGGLAEHAFEAVRASGAAIVVDETLERYGCEVRGRFARVRASASERLQRVAEALQEEDK